MTRTVDALFTPPIATVYGSLTALAGTLHSEERSANFVAPPRIDFKWEVCSANIGGQYMHGLQTILSDAGINTKSTVQVAGEAALPFVLWLCGRGYEHVVCVPAPNTERLDADGALIMPQTMAAADLKDLLAHTDKVAQGSVLIIQTPSLRLVDGRNLTTELLRGGGYRPERRFQRRLGEMHVARRIHAPAKRAA